MPFHGGDSYWPKSLRDSVLRGVTERAPWTSSGGHFPNIATVPQPAVISTACEPARAGSFFREHPLRRRSHGFARGVLIDSTAMSASLRVLVFAFILGIVVAPSSLAYAQTSLTGGVVGAVYRTSESFELPGVGAVLGELGDIQHDARPGLDVAVGARLSPIAPRERRLRLAPAPGR